MLSKKYLITYTLRTNNWNYKGFYDAIITLGAWWHYIDSTWIIKNSQYTTQQMYSILAPHLSTKDSILIIEIVPENKFGFLPADAWQWLNT